MSNSVAIVLSKLGFNQEVRYSRANNAFLTNGYTSNAGNTYFNAIRFSESLVIKEDIGQGYARTFLNGLKIYTNEGTLVAEARYNCNFYSLDTVISESCRLLVNKMLEVAQRQNVYLNEGELRQNVTREINQAARENQLNRIQNRVAA